MQTFFFPLFSECTPTGHKITKWSKHQLSEQTLSSSSGTLTVEIPSQKVLILICIHLQLLPFLSTATSLTVVLQREEHPALQQFTQNQDTPLECR